MPWPKPPPKNQLCDNRTSVEFDWSNAPVTIRCQNLATETCKTVGGTYNVVRTMWLCEPCAQRLEQKELITRNPKRNRNR